MLHGLQVSRSGSSIQGQNLHISRRTWGAIAEDKDLPRTSGLAIENGKANKQGVRTVPTRSRGFVSSHFVSNHFVTTQTSTRGAGMTQNGPPSTDQDKIYIGSTNTKEDTTTPPTDLSPRGYLTLTCEQYNCHGFKQASDYVMKRLDINDVLCLTETWLRPFELYSIHETINKYSATLGKNCILFSKSGMEQTDPTYCGRPYGGLCIIVKKSDLYTVREIETPSERIVAVGLYDAANHLRQIIVCTYMPFHDGSTTQLLEYVEAIDVLQTIIDKYGSKAPVLLVGDFNAQLPTASRLHRKWYTAKGFNKHSCLLYDFICGNDLIAADLCFKQTVDYTYFRHSSSHYTWIDHVLCFERDFDKIKNCVIKPEEAHNVSDHLPVQTTITILTSEKSAPKGSVESNVCFMPPNWNNSNVKAKYCTILAEKLSNIYPMNDIPDDNIAEWIDNRLATVNSIIHESAAEAGCIPKRMSRPKPYWCPELSELRDKKRYWWSIWVSAGRPRNGTIFEIWKGLKKQFRRQARHNVQNMISRDLNIINNLYNKRQMKAFWNKLKRHQQGKVCSTLSAENLAQFYKTIMSDDGELTDAQTDIKNSVHNYSTKNSNYSTTDVVIEPDLVKRLVKSLKQGTSPGCDGITVEHLTYGMSHTLASILAQLYSVALSHAIVPHVFASGLIIPIIKKPSSDPNEPSNFRPITLSSVHSKIVELIIMPSPDISNCQFGFRENRGTSFVNSTINDCAAYFKAKRSPMFLCSLDAEKCFDSIWHDALLYKLIPILPLHIWLFVHRWYKMSKAVVRWNGCNSSEFRISRGMRQGSVLSPTLFNIFLDELLQTLQNQPDGIRVLDLQLNCCTYADDITLFCSTVPGLQRLIDTCVTYANSYRFRFGLKKSKCMVMGSRYAQETPIWRIGPCQIETVNQTDILGITFDTSQSCASHVDNRINASRRRIYSLANIGMSYPGLASGAKTHIWNSVGAPMMAYGMDCVTLSKGQVRQLKTAQASTIKRVMGIPQRSHNTNLLRALHIESIDDVINKSAKNLFHRIFQCDSPARDLQSRLLASYTESRKTIKGTLVDRLVSMGASPMTIAFTKPHKHVLFNSDGIIDSLRYMLFHDNYIHPKSNEHFLATLLLKAF